MHHAHIDRFAGMTSYIHMLDPRAKLLSSLAFIIIVVLTPDRYFLCYSLYAATMWLVIYLSNIPMSYILKRSLTIVPFALIAALFVPFITPGDPVWTLSAGPIEAAVTDNGLLRFAAIAFKSFICFFTTITLVSSTRFGDLMRAAGDIGVPGKLVIILSFMYRYLFILIDEAGHMVLARDLRGSGIKKLPLLTASGGIIGALLVRSFEHAEKLYFAMLLRGYSGKPVTLNPMILTVKDIAFTAGFVGIAMAGLAAGYIYYI